MMTTDLAPRDTLFTQIEQVTNLPAGCLHPMGLRLVDPDLTQERWIEIGRGLGAMSGWSRWALGDWLNFGEAVYGEDVANQATDPTPSDRYDVASRITGLKPATLQNYARICNLIPLGRRHPALDFSMHEPVAALSPEEQDEWLQRAVDEAWDRAQLREAISEWRNPGGSEPEPEPEPGRPLYHQSEVLEQAARQVYNLARPQADGSVVVPAEPWRRLAAALGEE